jgi:DUF4097 and DUF4098 domain-containing protein YvlB
MKFHSLAVIAGLFAAAVCAQANSYDFKEPFSKSGAFSPNGTLTLENVNGGVTVRSWDKNEILIEGEKSAASEEELKLIDLRMSVTDSRAEIKVKLPKRPHSWFGGNTIRAAVHFTITVPAATAIDRLSVVNSTVTIENILGRVNADSVNGGIHASGLAGDARLQTVNGSVDAAFSRIDSRQELSFQTVNGSVKVRLPADAGANVNARTVNGRISTDFGLNSSGGFVGRNLDGKIGDGRASLHAETVNGGIHIEKT